MTSWVPEGELLGQGSICPGPCLRWPWKVSVPGDPTGGCKKRPCLKFSLEQEDLKLRQLLDYLFLVSHVSWDLRSPRGYHMGPPNQTKGSPEPFSRGLRARAGDSGQARLFRPFSFSPMGSERSRCSHILGKRQHPNSFFLPPTHTPTQGLAGNSRRKADPMVYGAFEDILSNSLTDARTSNTVSLTYDPLASI